MRWVLWIAFLALATGAAVVTDVEFNPVRTHAHAPSYSGRIMVKLRHAGALEPSAAAETVESGRQRLAVVTARTAIGVRAARAITAQLHVLELDAAAGEERAAVVERLRTDPEVEYAELEQRRYIHVVLPPNDTLYPQQWYLQNPATASPPTPSAIDAITAWSTTTGNAALVVADLDTGVRFDHPDLLAAASGGRLLPGYDFISDPFIANDNGAGRHAGAADPGDWITLSDSQQPQCSNLNPPAGTVFPIPSSWHGTRVSGILGALTNNGIGVAGVTWQTQILPVRVLGKCGGLDSDIVTGMLWAAGIAVAGVPANANPAKIVNMSFGGTGACSLAEQDAINQLHARGVLAVVSAGNEGSLVDTPANCTGAVAVAGLRHAGTKVGFSSLGPEVAVGAPGGNCVNIAAGSTCLYPLTTTTNSGTTTPAGYPAAGTYTDQVNHPNLGTSFASPQVAGIAALMTAVNPNLNACQLRERLMEGAQRFPQTSVGESPQPPMCHPPASANDVQTQECICTNDGQTCGAGMANAPASLKAAQRPIATVNVPAAVTAGQPVVLQGGGGAISGHSIQSYLWTNPSGASVTIGGGNTATATVSALPACRLADVRLTVTDDLGRQDSADVIVSSNSATTAAPGAVNGAADCTEPVVQLAVCPTSASAQAAGPTVKFTADVAGTSNGAVGWQVNGVAGGNSTVGFIDQGVYTPPACVTAGTGTVSVSAVANADPGSTAAVNVSLSGSACVVPGSSSGGGGGAVDVLSLLALAGLGCGRRRYRSRAAASSH